jgi:Proteasome subunit
MTIAVGLKCGDGIVLAADSLYTEGITKLYGQKIFPIPSNGHYALTISGAGGVPSLKAITREIEKGLKKEIGHRDADFADLRLVVENALAAYYPKHIDSAPLHMQQDLGVQLLIATWVYGKGTVLFESCRASLFEIGEPRCIGVGSHLVAYLNDMFFPPGEKPSVRTAEPLAAYIVQQARRYVQYCGGRIFVRALLDDGTDERVWQDEIRDATGLFEEFFKCLGRVREMLGVAFDPQAVDMVPFAEILKDQVVQFRSKQQNYRDKQEQIRQRSRRLLP